MPNYNKRKANRKNKRQQRLKANVIFAAAEVVVAVPAAAAASGLANEMPPLAAAMYSIGQGVTRNKGDLSRGDAHCWLEDDSGTIHDPSPLLSEWREFNPTLHYHKARNSNALVAASLTLHEQFIAATVACCCWHDFYNDPKERNCYANCIEYQKRHPHLKLVVGSQGFKARGRQHIFWEFG